MASPASRRSAGRLRHRTSRPTGRRPRANRRAGAASRARASGRGAVCAA
jgi:hypothetical protein